MRHWFHADRRVYQSCYRQWHESSIAKGIPLRVERATPGAARPVYAPPSFREGEPEREFDIVFADNWLEHGTWHEERPLVEAAISQLVEHGHSVAITHLPWFDPIPDMRLALAPSLSKLLNETRLEFLGADVPSQARVLVARYAPMTPSGLSTPSEITVGLLLAVERGRFARTLLRRRNASLLGHVERVFGATATPVRESRMLEAVLAALRPVTG